MKIYTLYSAGPDAPFTIYSRDYSQGGYPWVITIRAASMRDAVELFRTQTACPGPRKAGVLTVDRSDGPPAVWPWALSYTQVTPQWHR